MERYLSNPYIVAAVCMLLFVVMYSNATNGFMRLFSYIPLAVALAVFVKGMYYTFKKR